MKKQINPKIKAHLIRSAFYVLLLLAVCVIPFALGQRADRKPVAPAGTTCPNPWQLVANMPLDLYGAACASNGTFVYCGGGYSFSQGNTLAAFNRYDPGTNTWTPLPNMPQAAIMATAVYYPTTNKIYIFGGEDAATGTNYSITRIYDIAGNSWTTGANMPDVRSFSAGGYSPATGMIYIISGYNTGFVDSAQPNTWQYNPVTNSWTDLTGTAPFPHPAGGMAFGVINNKLYIAGGRDAANLIINLNWEYDPVANAYAAKADEPASYQNNVPGSAAALDALWVFGGGNPFLGPGAGATKAAFPWAINKGELVQGKQPLTAATGLVQGDQPLAPTTANSTRFYDPSTNTWGTFSNMNAFRSFPGGAAVGNLLVAAGGYDGSFTLASAETVIACVSGGTPTPTPTPGPCQYRVLIAYADIGGQPAMIQNEILAEPDVTVVDLFDAFSGTPTLGQLQQYDIVYAFSNNAWNNAVAMGDVLADYEDGGGVVVVGTFAWDNRGGWNLAGRWMTGGYTPYNSTSTTLFSNNTANITDPGHPLMQGVSSLTAFYRNGVTLTAGAASVADWTDGPPAVAYKANNGHTAVGLNAYLGYLNQFSGEWGRVTVNAGRWLLPCVTPTPTPTPGQIVLTFTAYRAHGRKVVNLAWTGATTARVDIYRNEVPLARVPNSGSYTDVLTVQGLYFYKVCEAGTTNCSNEVRVRFPGP